MKIVDNSIAAVKHHCSGSTLTVFIVIAYLGLGVLFYCSVEEKDCTDENADEGCLEPWTWIDALYFCVVTISTVGYGDLSPSTNGSRVFTCFYIFFGIVFVFARVAASLEGVLQKVQDAFLSWLDKFDPTEKGLSGRSAGFSGKGVSVDGNNVADFALPPHWLLFWTQYLFFWVLMLLLLQLIAAAILSHINDEAYGLAFYHCWITATTVGYGDVPIASQEARLFSAFYIGVGVAWLAGFISYVDALADKRKSQWKRANMLISPLKWDKVQHFDDDGNGVEKLEFVVGMLMDLGVELCGEPLSWADVLPFVKLFEYTDKDKDNALSAADFEKWSNEKLTVMELAERQAARADARSLVNSFQAGLQAELQFKTEAPPANSLKKTAKVAPAQENGKDAPTALS